MALLRIMAIFIPLDVGFFPAYVIMLDTNSLQGVYLVYLLVIALTIRVFDALNRVLCAHMCHGMLGLMCLFIPTPRLVLPLP